MIEKIRHDRRMGLSIPELEEKYRIPRSSIWRLSHTVVLQPELLRAIQSRRGGSKKRQTVRMELAQLDATKLVQMNFTPAALPFILASLYWAEGTKSSFVFTNTDAAMIKVFLAILRDVFQIQNTRLQVLIRLGSNQSSSKAISFWAGVIGIKPEDVKLNIHDRYNRTKASHGLCRITVLKGGQLLKLITALNKEMSKVILR